MQGIPLSEVAGIDLGIAVQLGHHCVDIVRLRGVDQRSALLVVHAINVRSFLIQKLDYLTVVLLGSDVHREIPFVAEKIIIRFMVKQNFHGIDIPVFDSLM